jgi:hypothetical protein
LDQLSTAEGNGLNPCLAALRARDVPEPLFLQAQPEHVQALVEDLLDEAQEGRSGISCSVHGADGPCALAAYRQPVYGIPAVSPHRAVIAVGWVHPERPRSAELERADSPIYLHPQPCGEPLLRLRLTRVDAACWRVRLQTARLRFAEALAQRVLLEVHSTWGPRATRTIGCAHCGEPLALALQLDGSGLRRAVIRESSGDRHECAQKQSSNSRTFRPMNGCTLQDTIEKCEEIRRATHIERRSWGGVRAVTGLPERTAQRWLRMYEEALASGVLKLPA